METEMREPGLRPFLSSGTIWRADGICVAAELGHICDVCEETGPGDGKAPPSP